jgi:hypothetical protein
VGSVLALASHGLRVRLRSPAAAILAALAVPALALAADVSAAGGVLGVLVLAGLVAAAAGAALPEDRASGRAEWLGTLRPSAAAQRLSVALGGGALAVLAAGAASAVVAIVLGATGRGVPTASTRPLEVARAPGTPRASVALPDAARGERVVEIDTLPLVLDPTFATPAVQGVSVSWEPATTPPSEEAFPLRGSHRVIAPPGATRLVVDAPADAPAVPRVVAARLVGRPRSFVANVILAGLLVGLGAALAVPFAVLVSRGTSAPTAVLAAAVAFLVGVAREPLLSFAGDLDVATPAAALATGVVRFATGLAPDLSALRHAGEAAAGRAVPPAAFVGLLPAALHALVCLALLCVPSRRGRVA